MTTLCCSCQRTSRCVNNDSPFTCMSGTPCQQLNLLTDHPPKQVEEGTASGAAALHLAAYLFYSHSFERARSLLERQTDCLQSDPQVLRRAQALLGFVLLEQQAQEETELQDASELRTALQLFDDILQHDPSDLEVGVLRQHYCCAAS